jgi:hypothetical protein
LGISISNTDSALLEFCRRELIKQGFAPGRLKVDRFAGEKTNIAVVRNTLWQFNLSKKNDVANFAEAIGFADLKKQNKLEDAIKMIREYGHSGAIAHWTELYEKQSGDWIRKE